MSITFKVEKTSDRLNTFIESLKEADGSYTEVGYFDSQGIHTGSGLAFTHLADIHEHGRMIEHPNGYSIRIPPRPVLKQGMLSTRSGLKTSRVVKRSFRAWKTKLEKTGNPESLLDAIGQLGVRSVRQIFGSTTFLHPNAESTVNYKGFDKPLIYKGELRRNVAYRTSRTRTVKTNAR